jgi:hypothetical protein
MSMRNYRTLLLAPLLLLQYPGLATAQSGSVNHSPSAGDVATTPLRVVNLKKTKIPPVLQRAADAPYTLAGLNSCKQIVGQVRQLNAALGEDFDDAHARGHPLTTIRLAQSVMDSIIPFGGIIKEVSGANAEQRRLQAAVAAGFARRGFLKGVGLSRKCPAPARPA